MSPKKSIKTTSRCSNSPTPKVNLRKAKQLLPVASLASKQFHLPNKRTKARTPASQKPTKKRASKLITSIAVVTAVVGSALGTPSEARGALANFSSQNDLSAIVQNSVPDADVVIPKGLSFFAFRSGESVPLFMKKKSEQEMYQNRLVDGVKLINASTYHVPLENKTYARISLKTTLDRIVFTILRPKAGSDKSKILDSFSIDYGEYKFANPTLYITADLDMVSIWLINKPTSECMRIQMGKTNMDPNAILLSGYDGDFEQSTSQQAFALLNRFPVPAWGSSSTPTVLKTFFPRLQFMLRAEVSKYDAGKHRKDLSALIDDFIEMNANVIDAATLVLRKMTKNLSLADKKKVFKKAEAYLLALTLRPFAVWEDNPKVIVQLDKLIGSKHLTKLNLLDFAKRNRLLKEYRGIEPRVNALLSER